MQICRLCRWWLHFDKDRHGACLYHEDNPDVLVSDMPFIPISAPAEDNAVLGHLITVEDFGCTCWQRCSTKLGRIPLLRDRKRIERPIE